MFKDTKNVDDLKIAFLYCTNSRHITEKMYSSKRPTFYLITFIIKYVVYKICNYLFSENKI